MDLKDDEGIRFHFIKLEDRKFERSQERQTYAVYKQSDEPFSSAFSNIKACISIYKSLLGRYFLQNDPLFPRADENVAKYYFTENIAPKLYGDHKLHP